MLNTLPPLAIASDNKNKPNSQQYSKSHTKQTDNNNIERANIISQEGAGKHHLRNHEQSIQDDQVPVKSKTTKNEPLDNKTKLPIKAEHIPSSKDSGIDTGTVCSTNMTPDTVSINISNNDHNTELKGNVLEAGLDNTGYDEDSDESTIENNRRTEICEG